MKKLNKDIIIVGFALFAMFFGAGNLLFPPFLGLITGKSWLTGFTGFILADVGLSLLAILAIGKCGGIFFSKFHSKTRGLQISGNHKNISFFIFSISVTGLFATSR